MAVVASNTKAERKGIETRCMNCAILGHFFGNRFRLFSCGGIVLALSVSLLDERTERFEDASCLSLNASVAGFGR